MKYHKVFPVSLLLLWTLTASVSSQNDKVPEIKVKTISDGIELLCDGIRIVRPDGTELGKEKLLYKDENSGEYTCMVRSSEDESQEAEGPKIYVKFRTCDNCIKLDETSIAGLVVGNVVATIVIGVAVYLVASQTRTGPTSSHKKSSDRQHLVPNEARNQAFNDPNTPYQRLNINKVQKDTYDVLRK